MLQTLRDHIEKIVTLSDEEFEFISEHFSAKSYRKHQFILQEGEPAKYHFFVVSGLLKLVYSQHNGKEHILGFAMEDWWESDFQAYYTDTLATMSLICLEDTNVLRISLADYNIICRHIPKMEHFFLNKAHNGFIALQQRVLSLLTSNAQQRYEQLLEKHPKLIQRVPKSQLAAFLGVSRETLSRFNN